MSTDHKVNPSNSKRRQNGAKSRLTLAIFAGVLIPPVGLYLVFDLVLNLTSLSAPYDWVLNRCSEILNEVTYGIIWEKAMAGWNRVVQWLPHPESPRFFDWKSVCLFIAICVSTFLLSWNAKDVKDSLLNINRKIRHALRFPSTSDSVNARPGFESATRTMIDVFTESSKLFFLRLACRILLLLALLATVVIPLVVLYLAMDRALDWARFSFPDSQLNKDYPNLVRSITVLTSIGLISFLLQESLKKAKESLFDTLQSVRKVFGSIHWSSLRHKENPRSIWSGSFSATLNLVLSGIVLCVIFVCSFIALKSLGIDVKPEANGVPPVPPHTHPANASTQYSLFYLSEGDLMSKRGICATDTNLVQWLTSFKSAISSCSNDTEKVTLRVQAFASTAPVTKDSELDTVTSHTLLDTVTSHTFNLDISNQRSHAIIYFLTTEKPTFYGCKAALNDSGRWRRSEWMEPGYKVIYEPWQTHAKMSEAKTVKDGTLNNRRKNLEFLNRTVQIIIEDGGCLTKEVEIAPKPGSDGDA